MEIVVKNPNKDDLEDFFSDIKFMKPVKYIEDMNVVKEERGRGVGSKGLDNFLKQSKDKSFILQAYPYEVRFDKTQWKVAQKRLIQWYGEKGFIHVGSGWMYKK